MFEGEAMSPIIAVQPQGNVHPCKGTQPHPEPTCVGDTVFFTLLPRLVNDAHPDQRGQHDAAYHGNGDDAHRGPVLPAAKRLQDAHMAVSPFGPQGVGHFTGVFPSILQDDVANNQELVAGGEVMPFCHYQGLVALQPGNAWRRAARGFALEGHSFTHRCNMVFQWMNQGWSLWRGNHMQILASRGY